MRCPISKIPKSAHVKMDMNSGASKPSEGVMINGSELQ